ncbi:ATP-binding protein [Sphingomonas crocodyli]|uniref:histidine kinase n=1 Tax=Sphingomonas crocodyli TaxID=1979270 RepID=A0A437M0D6_9SPHN|nr:ATP-binding protein [Sphingomonas crocodyli]RVT91160.1 response regulator [Sphingomonas crocodyli]
MFDMVREMLAGSYAPHGYCLLWQPWLVWTHTISDALIAGAYFSIPLALIAFVRRRRDIAFGGIFWLFALFITACGATHVMNIWNLWHGDYAAEAIVKAVTALASVSTAIILWPLLPRAIALPSPSRLAEANTQLSARIRERDAALEALHAEIEEREKAEAALLQSRKMEAVGQLTGGIAHDFNNLLQVVAGNIELIARKVKADPTLTRMSTNALSAVERGKRLTGQLLAFSRLQRLELKNFDLVPLMREARELLGRTIGPSITIDVDVPMEDAVAIGDRVQLELAILNLAINARDAMPDGGRLSIGIRREYLSGRDDVEEGDYLAIDVSDTGSGMSAETAARVFEPFFTTKPVGKGSGLGLSMVFGMARQSGGTATIRSELGQGTTATIYLRAARGHELPVDQTEAADPRDVEQLGGLRVLIVDDEEEVRDVLGAMLEEFGCAVVQAGDGKEALALMEAEDPEAMVIDFAMPGMNGADVARAVLKARPDMRIVFATGFAQSDAIDAVMGEDAVVLRKPFGPATLAGALAKAVG